MFPSLGCVSKPICPSQLPPPASLSRHVKRPSRCQAVCRLRSFSLGKGRAVSPTQLNVSSQKHELKPPPVVSNRLAVPYRGFVPVLVPVQPGSVTEATWMWQSLGQLSLSSVVRGQALRFCVVHWGGRGRSEEERIKCLTFLSQ